jgi:hypothetical protein
MVAAINWRLKPTSAHRHRCSFAAGQPQPAGAQAEVLFRQGRHLLAAGQVAEACSAFENSQKVEPAVRCGGGVRRAAFAERKSTPPAIVDPSPLAPSERLMVTDERGGAAARAAPPMLARSAGNTWSFQRSRDGRRILIVRGYEIVEVDVDSDRPPRVKHRLNQWIVTANYAADDQHVIAVVNRGEGDISLAEGEFSVTQAGARRRQT